MQDTIKLSKVAINNLKTIERTKRILDKRGVPYKHQQNQLQIVIPTDNGKLSYYPTKGFYTHNALKGYANTVKELMEYVVRNGVGSFESDLKKYNTLSNHNPYFESSYDEVISDTPVYGLEVINFDSNDSKEDIDYKIYLCKQYKYAINRLQWLLGNDLVKNTDAYTETLNHINAIAVVNNSLSKKYPFLNKGGKQLQDFLLNVLKEDTSPEKWSEYIEKAYDLMINDCLSNLD